MQKWEHKTLTARGPFERGKLLKQYGDSGWELVAVTEKTVKASAVDIFKGDAETETEYTLYFKRQQNN